MRAGKAIALRRCVPGQSAPTRTTKRFSKRMIRRASFSPSDFALTDDGTMDTVIVYVPSGEEIRYNAEIAADYRDPDTGAIDEQRFITEVVIPDFESDADSFKNDLSARRINTKQSEFEVVISAAETDVEHYLSMAEQYESYIQNDYEPQSGILLVWFGNEADALAYAEDQGGDVSKSSRGSVRKAYQVAVSIGDGDEVEMILEADKFEATSTHIFGDELTVTFETEYAAQQYADAMGGTMKQLRPRTKYDWYGAVGDAISSIDELIGNINAQSNGPDDVELATDLAQAVSVLSQNEPDVVTASQILRGVLNFYNLTGDWRVWLGDITRGIEEMAEEVPYAASLQEFTIKGRPVDKRIIKYDWYQSVRDAIGSIDELIGQVNEHGPGDADLATELARAISQLEQRDPDVVTAAQILNGILSDFNLNGDWRVWIGDLSRGLDYMANEAAQAASLSGSTTKAANTTVAVTPAGMADEQDFLTSQAVGYPTYQNMSVQGDTAVFYFGEPEDAMSFAAEVEDMANDMLQGIETVEVKNLQSSVVTKLALTYQDVGFDTKVEDVQADNGSSLGTIEEGPAGQFYWSLQTGQSGNASTIEDARSDLERAYFA